MTQIEKQNEFGSFVMKNQQIESTCNSRYINFSYYFDSSTTSLTLPDSEIRKIKIQSTRAIFYVLFFFAAMSVAIGVLSDYDFDAGVVSAGGNTIAGVVIALLFIAGAFIFSRSKFGQLKILTGSYKGNNVVLFVSHNKEELQQLQTDIQREMAGGNR